MAEEWGLKSPGLGKRPFRLDLAELHAHCEANYARLLQLFPDYETSNTREFTVGSARLRIEVGERSRYTTSFHLMQQSGSRWLGPLRIEVRAYHDAGMAEVVAFQSRRHIAPRYRYPNAQMLQQDEKCGQNQFLAEWLEHCLRNGQSALDARSLLTGA